MMRQQLLRVNLVLLFAAAAIVGSTVAYRNAQAMPVAPVVDVARATAPALAKPLGYVKARRVTVTATATNLYSLISTQFGDQLTGNCAIDLINNTSTQINVGGSDVDNSTKYVSLCNTTSCDKSEQPIDTGVASVAVRTVTGSATLVVWYGGGC